MVISASSEIKTEQEYVKAESFADSNYARALGYDSTRTWTRWGKEFIPGEGGYSRWLAAVGHVFAGSGSAKTQAVQLKPYFNTQGEMLEGSVSGEEKASKENGGLKGAILSVGNAINDLAIVQAVSRAVSSIPALFFEAPAQKTTEEKSVADTESITDIESDDNTENSKTAEVDPDVIAAVESLVTKVSGPGRLDLNSPENQALAASLIKQRAARLERVLANQVSIDFTSHVSKTGLERRVKVAEVLGNISNFCNSREYAMQKSIHESEYMLRSYGLMKQFS